MDDELVLLTSYFNLSGGRRQDNADTFRVEPSVQSGTSEDGTGALYVVTEASTGGSMGLRARRRAADVIVWEYNSRSEDAPIARIKASLRAAHEILAKEFDGHVAVGATVMAVEEDNVYLGQVAPAQVYVVHAGGLHSMSAQPGGSSVFAHALGSNHGPRISIFRDQIGPEDVVTLCSSWFHREAEPDQIRECFGAGTAEDIAESLLDLAKVSDVGDATGIVVEAVSAGELEAQSARDQAPTFTEQVDIAVQALAGFGRMLWSELRPQSGVVEGGGTVAASSRPAATTDSEEPMPEARPDSTRRRGGARPITPDVDSVEPAAQQRRATQSTQGEEWRGDEPASQPREPERRTSRVVADQATDEVPMILPGMSSDDQTAASAAPETRRRNGQSVHGAHSVIREVASAGKEESDLESERPSVWEMEEINSRLQNAPDLGDVIPPVQAFPDTSTEPERIYATSRDIEAANKRPRRFGGIAGSGRKDPLSGAPVLRPGIGDLDLNRPAGRPAPPAVVWFGIAAVFALAAAAGYLYYRHPHSTAVVPPYATYVSQNIALAQKAATPAQQDAYLAKARTNLRSAQEHGASQTQINQLAARLQSVTDSLHHVTRVTAAQVQTLADFAKIPNAQPTEIATSPGIVFVRDGTRKSVLSLSADAPSNPNLVTQAGEGVSGFTVGMPSHLATDGSTVLVLDDHNILVRDAAGTKTAISLPAVAGKQSVIVSMASADPDIYLLDTANSQVWRYPSAVSGFGPTPSGYFTSNPPNLSKSVSFALDGSDMYILQADGTVLKFDTQANAQKFTMNLPQPLQKPSQIFTDRGLNFVWIVDPPTGRVVQLDKSGNYIRTYQSSVSGMRFDQIKSFAVGPAGNSIYVLAGSRLYKFPVVH